MAIDQTLTVWPVLLFEKETKLLDGRFIEIKVLNKLDF